MCKEIQYYQNYQDLDLPKVQNNYGVRFMKNVSNLYPQKNYRTIENKTMQIYAEINEISSLTTHSR